MAEAMLFVPLKPVGVEMRISILGPALALVTTTLVGCAGSIVGRYPRP
jgi:hypothetical protein